MKWVAAVTICFACGTFSASAQDIALRPFEVSGFAAMNGGDNARCAAIFVAAAQEHREEPSLAFVAARCFARDGKMSEATRYLMMALDRGYRNCANLERESALAGVEGTRARCTANSEAFVRSTNPELLAAYLADRADRTGPIQDPEAVMQRDRARQDVVRAGMTHKALRTADDYFHAAWITQHGSTPDAYDLARTLAKRAVRMRSWFAEARWLYAAATDRYLQSTGKPQVFGTQYRQVDGKWTLEPFDPAAISDAERARWRAHSVAEREQFIADLNKPRQ
jgi:hypothetical protein